MDTIDSFDVRVVHPEGLGFRIGRHLWVDQMMILFRIRTADGNEGVAGTTTYGPGRSVAYALSDIVGPGLIGADPTERERIWQQFFRLSKLYLPPQASAVADCALWDLAGKQFGVPVHRLLGTAKTSLPAYASSLTYPDLAGFLEAVSGFVEQGFR